MLNERVGTYEISRRLATGGMAEIYLAHRRGPGGFEKQVVIKRIAKKLLGDRDICNMFLDEARVQALLDHQNIVQIHELNEDGGSYFIVMEFVPGATVRWLIGNANVHGARVPVAHALRIAADMLTGLHYAHERSDGQGRHLGLIHRDISPVNILVSRTGVSKLCDFGIAKSKVQSVMTRIGVVKGKFRYMSPEQVTGSPIDRRVDIFAVGNVLFETLTGRQLFDQVTDEEVVEAIRRGIYPRASAFRPDLPRGVERLIEVALRRDPDRRFQTARAFRLALELEMSQLPTRSNALLLAEYLDHQLGHHPAITSSPFDDKESGLFSGSYTALDPPAPESSRAQPDVSTSGTTASVFGLLMALVLLLPIVPVALPLLVVERLLAGHRRP